MTIAFKITKEEQNKQTGLFLRELGISACLLKQLKNAENGLVVNKKQVFTNYQLQLNDTLEINLPQEKKVSTMPQNLPLQIVYQSPYTMLINKPAGQAVHPTLNYTQNTLANAWCYHQLKNNKSAVFRPVNRLDVNTSGLVVCALNALSVNMLPQNMQKSYIVLVKGCLAVQSFVINEPIARKEGSIIERTVNKNGKQSQTNCQVLASNNNISVLKVTPQTGRTHQIRVHCSYIGHPLLGDDLYGGTKELIDRQALHCFAVTWNEPFTKQKPLTIYAKLPQDMSEIIQENNLVHPLLKSITR